MGQAFAMAAFELLLVGCVLDFNGAVARIRDLISTSIQFICRSEVTFSPCSRLLTKPFDHQNIFWSIIESM